MNGKVYQLKINGKVHNIILCKSTYRSNNTLAISMIEVLPDGTEEDWSVLTVNIEASDFCANSINTAFVDSNNNGSHIIKWLQDNNIAFDTGLKGYSGFCCYPLVLFTDESLKVMRRF